MRHTGVSVEGPAKVESIIREQLPHVIGSAVRIFICLLQRARARWGRRA